MGKEEVQKAIIEKLDEVLDIVNAYIAESGARPKAGAETVLNTVIQLDGYIYGYVFSDEVDDDGFNKDIINFYRPAHKKENEEGNNE